jgi:hypothetical protein
MVWLSIEIVFLSRKLDVYNSRHPRHEVFWPHNSTTHNLYNESEMVAARSEQAVHG